MLAKACFVAGTPILTPYGHQPIESLSIGDRVWARPQDQPDAPPRVQVVEKTFHRTSAIVRLHVAERLIETTDAHPFFVVGRGWTPAGELRVGDLIASHRGAPTAVTFVERDPREQPVYNVRVSEDHTYFVGAADWPFTLWAHNWGDCNKQTGEAVEATVGNSGHGILGFESQNDDYLFNPVPTPGPDEPAWEPVPRVGDSTGDRESAELPPPPPPLEPDAPPPPPVVISPSVQKRVDEDRAELERDGEIKYLHVRTDAGVAYLRLVVGADEMRRSEPRWPSGKPLTDPWTGEQIVVYVATDKRTGKQRILRFMDDGSIIVYRDPEMFQLAMLQAESYHRFLIFGGPAITILTGATQERVLTLPTGGPRLVLRPTARVREAGQSRVDISESEPTTELKPAPSRPKPTTPDPADTPDLGGTGKPKPTTNPEQPGAPESPGGKKDGTRLRMPEEATKRSDRTYPTGERGGRPFGRRSTNNANADPEFKRGIDRENNSADALAREGYKVEQNPSVPEQTTNPDFRIQGRLFDNYAPTTSDARGIVNVINFKAARQAPRIVLNLRDSNVTRHALREALRQYGSSLLQEIILIDKNGSITHFYP